MSTTTYQTRSSRPLPVVLVNAAGRVLSRLDASPLRLDPDDLVATARRRTGLADFGEEGWRERLEVLVDALERESALTPMGRIVARRHLLRLLINRLRIEEHRHRVPAVAVRPVASPLFITGLPRSGTSLLHGLLARDPAHRSPLVWETMLPCRTPGRAGARDARLDVARRHVRWFKRLAPRFRAIHEVGADLPQECIDIMGHAFQSMVFETMYHVPTYTRWLGSQDMQPAYRMHRRFLQHLQEPEPAPRWVLKAPAHLFHLEAIIAAYPDAMIVHTHREPLEVLPSVASLLATLRGAFSEGVDPMAIGREVSQKWLDGLQAAGAARTGGLVAPESVFDVCYEDLVADPLDVVARIYEYFGLELSAAAERCMLEHLPRVDRGRRPEHVYTLETFGLDREEQRDRYKGYRAQLERVDRRVVAVGGET